MAQAPGVVVTTRAELAPTTAGSPTGRLFAVGVTEKGPLEPTNIIGLGGFERIFGGRTNQTTLIDSVAAFFGTGGAQVVVSRVVGPGAEFASGTEPGEYTVTARNPGAAGNDLSVEVTAANNSFVVDVLDDGALQERFLDIDTIGDLVAVLSGDSAIVTATDESSDPSDPPSTGTTSLSGGDDDHANITDTQWREALDRFGVELGPGQVAMPTHLDSDTELVAHAEDRNRIALVTEAVDADLSDLIALGEGSIDTRTAHVGYWATIRSGGRLRTVPGSALFAGIISARDFDFPTAHKAAAGENGGVLDGVVELIQPELTEDDRGQLNSIGVNVALTRPGRVLNYGFRTAAGDGRPFKSLAIARYRMSLESRVGALAEQFLFQPLTRRRVADFGNEITGLLLADFEVGALFGDDPDEAFTVDVGEDINPNSQLAEGVLRAALAVTPTPTSERILIDIVKRRPR